MTFHGHAAGMAEKLTHCGVGGKVLVLYDFWRLLGAGVKDLIYYLVIQFLT